MTGLSNNELEQLKAAGATAHSDSQWIPRMANEILSLRARNAELVAALREYGMHKQDCERNETYGSEPCDCGYDAAIAKAGGKE